jgi:hypothetical protein
MSDSRFNLEVKFQIYGKTFKWNPSLNWSDNGDGIDQRIVDWFRERHDTAHSDFLKATRKHFIAEEKRKAEEAERKEYERLKAKFDGGNV